LIAKIKDGRQFWSTVPEIVWAARLDRLGATVTMEPIVGRTGPDFRFDLSGFSAHAEVYSPVFQSDEFSWSSDLHGALENLDDGFRVSAQKLPARQSQNLGIIHRALRRVLVELRARNDRRDFRLYVWSDRRQRVELLPPGTIEIDPVIDHTDSPFFVADIAYAPELGGVWTASHASNAHRDMSDLMSGLGQLQPGANLLIVDANREFILPSMIERACAAPRGAFERHPELSAVAVSAWGVYPAPTTNPLLDHVFVEEYTLIENPRADSPIPAALLAEMKRTHLLDERA